MAASWFVMHGDDRRGPYSAETFQNMLRDRVIHPDDLVWCDGMPDWLPARSVMRPGEGPSERMRRRRPAYDDAPYPSVAATTGPPGQFPGRLVTPSFFLLCIFFFFLPWIDIRCGPSTVAYQNGLQLCYGGFAETINAEMEPALRRAGEDGNVAPSFLAIGFGVLILAGFICGLALHTGVLRIVLTAGPALVGMTLLLIQFSIGFPVASRVEAVNLKLRAAGPGAMPRPPIMFPGPGMGAIDRLDVCTTPWFWLTIVFALSVNGALLIEHLAIFGKTSHAAADLGWNEFDDDY
ncbi:MAG: DUF4339 domain-containing protein [Gemmataceae bacterium]